MEFRIAHTFTDSLAKLTGDEQKSAKTTAFDLQLDPSGAGRSFRKLDRAKDRNFWSIRVSRDIRLIVHRTASSVLLAYVGHHDAVSTAAVGTSLSLRRSSRAKAAPMPWPPRSTSSLFPTHDANASACRQAGLRPSGLPAARP